MPLFYKIIKNNKISYLFGTCHFTDSEDKIVTLPIEVKKAFEEAPCLVVETLPESDKIEAFMTAWQEKEVKKGTLWTFAEMEKIADKLEFQLAVTGTPVKALFDMLKKPPLHIYFGMTLGSLAPGLDKRLIDKAMWLEKSIVQLESIEDALRIGLATDFSYEEQVELFRHSLAYHEAHPEFLEKTMRSYLEDKAQEFIDTRSHDQSSLGKRYMNRLIHDRDKEFVVGVEKVMQEHNNAFVAVGALHILGMTELLKQKGYTVEVVPVSERSVHVNYLGMDNNSSVSLNMSSAMFHHHIPEVFFDEDEWLDLIHQLPKEKLKNNCRVELRERLDEESMRKIVDGMQHPNCPDGLVIDLCGAGKDIADLIPILVAGIEHANNINDLCIRFNASEVGDKGLLVFIDMYRQGKFPATLKVEMGHEFFTGCSLEADFFAARNTPSKRI